MYCKSCGEFIKIVNFRPPLRFQRCFGYRYSVGVSTRKDGLDKFGQWLPLFPEKLTAERSRLSSSQDAAEMADAHLGFRDFMFAQDVERVWAKLNKNGKPGALLFRNCGRRRVTAAINDTRNAELVSLRPRPGSLAV